MMMSYKRSKGGMMKSTSMTWGWGLMLRTRSARGRRWDSGGNEWAC